MRYKFVLSLTIKNKLMKNHYFSPLRIVLSVLTVFLAVIVYSCTPPPAEDPVLTIEPSVASIVFSADGKTAAANGQEISAAFGVTTNQEEWSIDISEKNSWLSVDKTDNTFTLSAEANKESDDRGPITVTVKAGKEAVVITVRQLARNLPATDVYVVGVDNLSMDSGTAVYWKNGERFVLQPDAGAMGITISDNDIYITGAIISNMNMKPVYWKNGELVNLYSMGNYYYGGKGTSIVVSGDYIYVAGIDNGQIVYWENGQRTVLCNEAHGTPIGIALSGTDVYVTGTSHSLPMTARYWKNEQEVVLKYDNHRTLSNSIALSGSDIYVGGIVSTDDMTTAAYWKNNQVVLLSNETYSFVNDIVVSGQDVYCVGDIIDNNGKMSAVYWKNGNLVKLSTAEYSTAVCATVFEGDIYVAGYEIEEEKYTVKYWINGKEIILPSQDEAEVYGIAVKHKE